MEISKIPTSLKPLNEYEVGGLGVEGGRLDHRLAAFTALFESQSDAILYFDGWRVNELLIQD